MALAEYRRTVNLPRTDFPMRAQLPEREPAIQARWEELDIYGRLRRLRAGRRRFVLHDGPPYANGHIHIGTALNKVLKDFVVRYASLRGCDAPFVPGWDTHGLPIEIKALQELGVDRREIGVAELRERCAAFARGYIEIMTRQFRRLGCLGDWDHPYITLEPAYEAAQLRVFGEMAERGYIYRGLKPVYWCPVCETALAEAEIEYRERRSPSIYVAFSLEESGSTAGGVRAGAGEGAKLPAGARVPIWTTTPWTLPGNAAIALHPRGEYAAYATERGILVLARVLAARVLEHLGLEGRPAGGPWTGAELEGILCRHPFLDRAVPIILGEHVSLEEGTGCVHTAPGHGPEDFEVGRRYGLPVLVPVDGQGNLTAEAGPFAGLTCREADEIIPLALEESGHLLRREFIEHQYAHCWRCKNPVIWRATEQWFASVDGFRAEALAAIGRVRWIPAWGETRIANMVAQRSDWCISRQRAWGVPIPAFYCRACGQVLLARSVIETVADLFAREGSNAWFLRPAEEILPPGTRCPACGGAAFAKETDTMDVWFDSGSSHAAVLAVRPDLAWPADLYLEGSDQHRGWFQSSLLTAVATRGAAPYRAVLTHGFVVDGEGRKMSKSLGNVVEPEEVVGTYGADVLRLWVASADYSGDVRISPDILAQLAEVYRKIRNTLRYLLGNLAGWSLTDRRLTREECSRLPEIDRWLLLRLAETGDEVARAYDEHQYHRVYRAVHRLCVDELSSFYLEVVKDRLYCEAPAAEERRQAQAAIYEVARALIHYVAPILPHTADEAWSHLPRALGEPESVHLSDWPVLPEAWRDPALADRWRAFLELRAEVYRALEQARAEGVLGDSLEAAVTIGAAPDLLARLGPLAGEDLAGLLVVSEAILTQGAGTAVVVSRAAGRKCERCWRRRRDVGGDRRHPDLCTRCARVVAEHFASV